MVFAGFDSLPPASIGRLKNLFGRNYKMENNKMEINQRIKPLSPAERRYATDNYYLINTFLKRSRLNPEEYFDIVVFDFLRSVQAYLDDDDLQKNFCFEAVSYMYMRRAVYTHLREQKAQKRCSGCGADVSFDEMEDHVVKSVDNMENISLLEYAELMEQIRTILTAEQWRILCGKMDGYTLKEIAEHYGIKPKRVYYQFGKIKNVVAVVMDI